MRGKKKDDTDLAAKLAEMEEKNKILENKLKSREELERQADLEIEAAERELPQANKYKTKNLPKRKVKVHRMGVDENNRYLPIVVLVNDIRSKREFMPGEIVELDAVQLQSLRDAAFNCKIPIPDDSAIYDSKDPLRAAEKMYEGMHAYRDPVTMKIWVTKTEERYLIEPVE